MLVKYSVKQTQFDWCNNLEGDWSTKINFSHTLTGIYLIIKNN